VFNETGKSRVLLGLNLSHRRTVEILRAGRSVKNIIRDISENKVTEYGLNDIGSIPGKGKDLSLHHYIHANKEFLSPTSRVRVLP
jgi:hypothetical protein